VIQAPLTWLADRLVLLGMVTTIVAVYGLIRLPDVYTRLHAASKVAVLGVIPILLASTVTGDPAIVFRVVLIGVFLVLTTPVAAHAIGRTAYLQGTLTASADRDGPASAGGRRRDVEDRAR
jgi:multicomponent Na+:H+ antiporter subunit G